MSGRNQHHIPQFLQRGFGVRRAGKSKEIWKYEKGNEPELSEIKRTAAEDCFYSQLSEDGLRTLDDQITDLETPISRKVAMLRRASVGSIVDSALSVEVLTHLAPRTSHLRSVIGHGVVGLLQSMQEIFTDKASLATLLGLDGDRPSAKFREHITDRLETDSQFAQLGLPPVVLEQVIFWLARENFDGLFESQMSQMQAAFEIMTLTAPGAVRKGHNQALTEMIVDGNKRDDLLAYRWAVKAAPSEGAVLPDCVAFALLEGDIPRPFVGASNDDIRAIVLPLSSDRLLVGTKNDDVILVQEKLNAAAAACSHEFFLAMSDKHSILIEEIGRFSAIDIDESINGAIREFRVTRLPTAVTERRDVPSGNDAEIENEHPSRAFRYQVSCFDFGDQELVERLAEVLKYIISNLSQVMPLDRLEGITFAVDYSSALSSIDRGRPDIPAAKTAGMDTAVAVAMTVPIERDGWIKSHIVLHSSIGLGLINDFDKGGQWALYTLVHELANVSMIQIFDEAFPNVFFNPLPDSYEGQLFLTATNALDGYAAARISSCFGDSDEIMRIYRELLVLILANAQQKISDARFAYRYDGDLSKLVDVACPVVGHILSFSAKLLGHSDGLRCSAFDDEGVVQLAIEKTGLFAWFKIFEADLRSYWEHRGQWKSLDELFLFNRHVERVFWQFGMFWSRDESGKSRLDIPIATDAVRLFEATIAGVPHLNRQ